MSAERIRDILTRAPTDNLLELVALAAADAEERADACRATSLAALDVVAQRDAEIDRLRRQLSALRDELRRYTASAVREAA